MQSEQSTHFLLQQQSNPTSKGTLAPQNSTLSIQTSDKP
jgi:hypothetical protein